MACGAPEELELVRTLARGRVARSKDERQPVQRVLQGPLPDCDVAPVVQASHCKMHLRLQRLGSLLADEPRPH